MNNPPVIRDERTISVENASYRLGYIVISFGLLLLITLRGFLYQESNWDLMALVVVGGILTTVYQALHGTITMRMLVLLLFIAVVSAIAAVVLVLLLKSNSAIF